MSLRDGTISANPRFSNEAIIVFGSDPDTARGNCRVLTAGALERNSAGLSATIPGSDVDRP